MRKSKCWKLEREIENFYEFWRRCSLPINSSCRHRHLCRLQNNTKVFIIFTPHFFFIFIFLWRWTSFCGFTIYTSFSLNWIKQEITNYFGNESLLNTCTLILYIKTQNARNCAENYYLKMRNKIGRKQLPSGNNVEILDICLHEFSYCCMKTWALLFFFFRPSLSCCYCWCWCCCCCCRGVCLENFIPI